jgi:serine acetyltransferase
VRPRTPEQLWALSRRLHQRGWDRSARIVKTLNYFLHKALLPAEAVVGDDIILEHYALGIVLHPNVTIGDRCRIYHNVTLAAESAIGSPHRIILEDDVTVGTHSVIIARANTSLTIGKGSVIGAGSVVTKDVPAGEVWAGNPARKLRNV